MLLPRGGLLPDHLAYIAQGMPGSLEEPGVLQLTKASG